MRPFRRNAVHNRAFTLVELLVVIAIIGVLVALLLPAIQAAREAARRSQCSNNLKQLGLAVQMHHDAKQAYPTGRNASDTRSVSWAYYSLPYLEQNTMFRAYRKELEVFDDLNSQTFRTPVPTFFCPSRRGPAADRDFDNNDAPTTKPGVAAGGDYAANAGESMGAEGDAYDPTETGPIFTRSRINARHVTDGTSNTFCLGEKYITELVEEDETPPEPGREHAYRGDSSIFAGDSRETVLRGTDERFPSSVPDDDDNERFGSEHNQQAHFAFLDGSVRVISYSIDEGVYEALGNFSDDIPIPANY
jgi:prepilin-type N-terminal cleavage/methylation domain-containing protein/prepilin-type processing-associated H-X9-DG protein